MWKTASNEVSEQVLAAVARKGLTVLDKLDSTVNQGPPNDGRQAPTLTEMLGPARPGQIEDKQAR